MEYSISSIVLISRLLNAFNETDSDNDGDGFDLNNTSLTTGSTNTPTTGGSPPVSPPVSIDDKDRNPALTGTDSDGSGTDRDAFEFVAFLLWYLFLVLCCVLPTCCAYRRRRLMEARLQQQQANFDQIQQQNVFILSNLHLHRHHHHGGAGGGRFDLDSEEARIERTKRITDALKPTTFTVAETNLSEKETTGVGDGKSDDKNSTERDGSGTNLSYVDEERGESTSTKGGAATASGGGDYDPADEFLDELDHCILALPTDAPNGSRDVPGGCAICLCPYEEGDEVSWSKETSCQHAFHQECIIPWLAKKDEPKCPCCRQDFCMVEPVTVADLAAAAAASTTSAATALGTPFGLVPHGLSEHHLNQQLLQQHQLLQRQLQSSPPATTTLSPDLTASHHIVNEDGLILSMSEPPTTTTSTMALIRSNSNATGNNRGVNRRGADDDNDIEAASASRISEVRNEEDISGEPVNVDAPSMTIPSSTGEGTDGVEETITVSR